MEDPRLEVNFPPLTRDPSQEEIRLACWEIQETWTELEGRTRGAWNAEQQQVVVPRLNEVVAESEW